MAWYLYLEGSGEGCDYTISCNVAVHKLSATTEEGARKEAIAEMGEEGYCDLWGHEEEGDVPDEELDWSIYNENHFDGYQIKRATLLWASEEIDLNLDDIRAGNKQKWQAALLSDAEASDRAEYERLKQKFGDDG